MSVGTGQLAFYGVRRVQGHYGDPAPSLYPYYEKPYSIPVTFQLVGNGAATGPGQMIQYTSHVDDYDFELRRIEGSKSIAGVVSGLDPVHPEFAITLYDSEWRARSNAPVNCNRLLHYPLAVNHPMNSWPSPGILYPVNAVIRFDVFSLIASGTLPVIMLLFTGVRRIRCND